MYKYSVKFQKLLWVACLSATLASCGGGSSSDRSNPSSSSPAPATQAVTPDGTAERPFVFNLEEPVRDIHGDEGIYYAVDVPEGKASLAISFAWGPQSSNFGDPDLYVRHESAPTTEEYDCISDDSEGKSEGCVIKLPKAGRYYVLIEPFKEDREKRGEHWINEGVLYATTELLKVHHTCENADADILAQTMTDTQKKFVCDRLEMTQKRFAKLFNYDSETLGNPVDDDPHERATVTLFADQKNHTAWLRYLIEEKNSSGVYHEGKLLDGKINPKSYPSGDLFTFNYLSLTNGMSHYWNLEHEYVHYLDGRYNKAGTSKSRERSRTAWWTEGVAEYVGQFNGPERRFRTAQAALNAVAEEEMVLSCDDVNAKYNPVGGEEVRSFVLKNKSSETIHAHWIKKTGDVHLLKIKIAPGKQWNFQKWYPGDRFVINKSPSEATGCLAIGATYHNTTLSYAEGGLSVAETQASAPSLDDIFATRGKTGQPSEYVWGNIAVAFLLEKRPDEARNYISLMRSGDYESAETVLTSLLVFDDDEDDVFKTWLKDGTRKSFENAFEAEDRQLSLNEHTTLYGTGDWAYKLNLDEDVDSLTIGTKFGSGDFTVVVGNKKPVHTEVGFNMDAVVCTAKKIKPAKEAKEGDNTEKGVQPQGPEQYCTIKDAKKGAYYITVMGPVSSVANKMANAKLFSCSGENCQQSFDFGETPEPEVAAPPRVPRTLGAINYKACDAVGQYELKKEKDFLLFLFGIENKTEQALKVFSIDAETGAETEVGEIAVSSKWFPTAEYYNGQRFSLKNSDGECQGVVVAKSSTLIKFAPSGNCHLLGEKYERPADLVKNFSFRNDSDKTVYFYWVSYQGFNTPSRRDTYAVVKPGETVKPATKWNYADRILLGTSVDSDLTQCLDIIQPADKEIVFTGQGKTQ